MIQANDLYFSYSGSLPYILDNINFNFRDGDYISILGENGCGKSTLIRLILKFIKPVKGSILSHAKRIGYVPQKSGYSNSGFPITVYEMLNSYRHLLKIKNKRAVFDCLEMVGLESCWNKLIGTLSGGQHQKVFIARALLGVPDLLLLDEPSTGIDVQSQKDIYSFLRKLNEENGVTIVSVEHNLEAAISNSTLIYHLSGGHGHLCTPEKFASKYLRTIERDENIV
jgi:zinc transport system ATP-binding protein